ARRRARPGAVPHGRRGHPAGDAAAAARPDCRGAHGLCPGAGHPGRAGRRRRGRPGGNLAGRPRGGAPDGGVGAGPDGAGCWCRIGSAPRGPARRDARSDPGYVERSAGSGWTRPLTPGPPPQAGRGRRRGDPSPGWGESLKTDATMAQQQLQALITDVDRLLAAGGATAGGDENLRRQARTLQEMGKQVEALAKIGQAVQRVVDASGKQATPPLLDLLLVTRQVRANLARAGHDGAALALDPARPWTTAI